MCVAPTLCCCHTSECTEVRRHFHFALCSCVLQQQLRSMYMHVGRDWLLSWCGQPLSRSLRVVSVQRSLQRTSITRARRWSTQMVVADLRCTLPALLKACGGAPVVALPYHESMSPYFFASKMHSRQAGSPRTSEHWKRNQRRSNELACMAPGDRPTAPVHAWALQQKGYGCVAG